mmetsp:Transcript_33191/g.80613  ORF Transcript_33191/g.80613 Transcript_33191/m.80613 type:complete len:204 (+) Transcript_33191:430-1041(+)
MKTLEDQITGKLMKVSSSFERFLKDFVLRNHAEFTWQEQPLTCWYRFTGLPPHIRLGCPSKPTSNCKYECCTSICFGCLGSGENESSDIDEEEHGATKAHDLKRVKDREDYHDEAGWPQGTVPTSVFYHDPKRNFTKTFLMGIETQILAFLVLLHVVMDNSFKNTLASLLVVAAANLVIETIRVYFGKDNLSKKTMLHERFFL